MTTTEPDFLTTAEVAAILRVHRTTVERMIKQGHLPGTLVIRSRSQRTYRIPRSALKSLEFQADESEQLKVPETPPLRSNSYSHLSRFAKTVR